MKIDRTFFNSKWRERLEELLILNNEKATRHIEELKLNLVSNFVIFVQQFWPWEKDTKWRDHSEGFQHVSAFMNDLHEHR